MTVLGAIFLPYLPPERLRPTAEAADRAGLELPERPLTGDDLRTLRLDTAVRGYRADDVDALLDRLAAELDRRPPAPDPEV